LKKSTRSDRPAEKRRVQGKTYLENIRRETHQQEKKAAVNASHGETKACPFVQFRSKEKEKKGGVRLRRGKREGTNKTWVGQSGKKDAPRWLPDRRGKGERDSQSWWGKIDTREEREAEGKFSLE